jgi:TrkA domain protein
VDVNETLLPGVGLRYEFDNADGDRIGVISSLRCSSSRSG